MWKKREHRGSPSTELAVVEEDVLIGDDTPVVRLERLLTRVRARSSRGKSEGTKGLAQDAAADIVSRLILDETVPFYLASPTGELVYSNRGFDELVRHFVTLDDGEAEADDESRVPTALKVVIDEVLAVRRNVTRQDTMRVSGRPRHFRSRHFPVTDDTGTLIAVGGTYIDSTDEVNALDKARRAQMRFNDFARATSDWFWETDEEGRLLSLSARMTDLLGTPVAKFLGQKLEQFGRFIADEKGEIPAVRAMTLRAPFRDQAFEVRTAAGESRLMHLSGVPVFDPADGTFAGYRGVGTDVTARLRAQQEAEDSRRELEDALEALTKKNMHLDVATAEAEAALKSKSDFLAAMSHELRTPLNAIIGFGEAMSMQVFGKLSPKYTTYSKDIVNAAQHLLALINDVLDVAVIDSGKLSLNPEPLDLRDIISQAVNLVVLRAKDKKIDLSKAEVEDDWVVLADARRLLQIFVNLLGNAVKFTPEGGEIGIDVERADDGLIAVTVWDTGIGIPEDKQGVVFEKFEQVIDDVYSRKEPGTGLGLHISRRLVRLMDGEITLSSEPGKGSRFTVTLPETTLPPVVSG